MLKINIHWTDEKLEKVKTYLDNWIKKHEAFAGEVIMQNDDCLIYAPELIAEIVDDVLKPEIEYD